MDVDENNEDFKDHNHIMRMTQKPDVILFNNIVHYKNKNIQGITHIRRGILIQLQNIQSDLRYVEIILRQDKVSFDSFVNYCEIKLYRDEKSD